MPSVCAAMLVLCACVCGSAAAERAPDVTAQRERFQALEAQLKGGADLTGSLETLQDYPLYPYLVYEDLVRDFDLRDRAAVAGFLERFADTHLASRLRYRWLQYLHRQAAWETFLDFYRPTAHTAMTCRHLEALAATGRTEEALEGAPAVWLAGESQPDECDPVFALMRREGRLTPNLVWRRIGLAMEAGRPSLARYLERFLPADQRPWVALWRRVRTSPALILEEHLMPPDEGLARAITAYGVARWARRAPLRAAEAWEAVRERYAFTAEERAETARTLGLRLYRRHPAEARRWLARVTDEVADDTVHRLRVMGSAKAGDWAAALRWLEARALDDEEEGKWRYWRGRALAALGRRQESETHYAVAARHRSYYGFLAADRLDRPYRLNRRPLEPDGALAERIRRLPALARIRELEALGRDLDVRREWHHLRGRLDKPELEALASIAHAEGWHFHAIVALGRSESWDYLDVRFPLAFRPVVTRLAEGQSLDPAWVYAVVRQESAFAPRARSPAGAMGLMQLLPRTARSVARTLRTRLDRGDLFEADANIALGTAYLRGLLDRFAGHRALATAAYNAGPHRVSAWLPEDDPLAADLWIEDIPFRETRRYVQRVFSYTVIYQESLDRPVERISTYLHPVPPAPAGS